MEKYDHVQNQSKCIIESHSTQIYLNGSFCGRPRRCRAQKKNKKSLFRCNSCLLHIIFVECVAFIWSFFNVIRVQTFERLGHRQRPLRFVSLHSRLRNCSLHEEGDSIRSFHKEGDETATKHTSCVQKLTLKAV